MQIDPVVLAPQVLAWAQKHFWSVNALFQLGAAVVCLLAGHLLGRLLRNELSRRYGSFLDGATLTGPVVKRLLRMLSPIMVLLLLLAALAGFRSVQETAHILRSATSLLGAWVGANVAASLIRGRFWRRLATLTMWMLAALNILGLLKPTVAMLDDAAITLGGLHLSAWTLFKGALSLAVLARLGLWLAALIERQLDSAAELSPSLRVLLAKVSRIALLVVAALLALTIVGVDLSVLTVLGGAVGLGVGFGLQKIIANLISGFILLLDKSIKPGDVIQLGDVYGWISRLQARYVAVVTRDGAEYLIPNEDLITNQVVNWSFSNTNIRLHIPVGVAYDADVRLAMRLMLEAAGGVDRVLADPGPVALLRGFGESSVDLELRLWIRDPQNGLANVRSEALLRIWDAFRAHGVALPFPQRDVHLDIADPGLRRLIEREEKP